MIFFYFRGNDFMVHSGLGSGVSPAGVHLSVHRFVDSVLDLKPLYMRMATTREMRETATSMEEKYGIKNMSLGVDGKIFPIMGKPRFKNPPTFMEPQGQDYWCTRKSTYGINGMLLTDGTFFREAVCHEPGRMHDSAVFANSAFKQYWANAAGNHGFLCAADKAYPLTRNIITPFREPEINRAPTQEEKDRMRLFNGKMSGARTELTECQFGRLVKMFPILNQLRYFMEENQRLIMACLILFNIKRTYNIMDNADDDMEDGDDEVEAQEEAQGEGQEDVDDQEEEEQRQPVPERTIGLRVRADLMATMARAPGRLDRVRHP